MQAKKLLSCGFAFLLVLAFAGVSSALDVSKDPGTWVRIEKPGDDAYAAMGDTVIVVVRTVSTATWVGIQVKDQTTVLSTNDEDEEPDNIPGFVLATTADLDPRDRSYRC